MSLENGVGAPSSAYEDSSTRMTLATITAGMAAVFLLMFSAMEILQGLAAIVDGDHYAAGTEYLYKFNTTAWGTIHLVLGVLGVAVAVGIFMRASWGPVMGMLVAGLTILANFAFLPHDPVSSIIVIGLSVLALWAFCVLNRADSAGRARGPAPSGVVTSHPPAHTM